MKPGARLQAGIEVLEDATKRHRPVSIALADWAKAHRFAGSSDRAAIGNLVYDVMRRRLSLAAKMESETARALVLAAAPHAFGVSQEVVIASADGTRYAITPLSDRERKNLCRDLPNDTPDYVRANIPQWLMPQFIDAFGDEAVSVGEKLAERAPADLRVNTLQTTREGAMKALERFSPVPARWSPVGIRLPAPKGARRQANVEAEAAHGKGWYEVQDEGSQIAAQLARARPDMRVLDLCAGEGGKTLALAATMQNQGELYAYDRDRHQLRPIFERLKRAGADNVTVLDAGDDDALGPLHDTCDVVLVDAPCTGTGVWRRRPDAKWRLRPKNLADRQQDQMEVLRRAHKLVKPGGRIVYVTCSLLPAENTATLARLLAETSNLAPIPYASVWRDTIASECPQSADGRADTLLLTPAHHETDGFFIAVLERNS